PRAPNCTGSKPNGDGRLDAGEDTNNNGALDPGEDRNGNGRLNFNEDFLIENGFLDFGEDLNHNCVRDAGEPDTNGDGILNTEDCDCDGWLDQQLEDRNLNGVRDFEDTVNRNSGLDAGIWCEDAGQPPITGLVPVPLGGEVLLYRQGNPAPEVLASVGSTGSGLTPYDSRVLGTLPSKAVSIENGRCTGGTNAGALCTSDSTCGGGVCTRFQLNIVQGQQLPAGAPRILNAHLALSPGAANAGQCSVALGLGPANLGVPLPITVSTSSGDTISIRLMSKQLGTFNTIDAASDYAVGANVTKNGVTLAPQGLSSASLGQSISFHVAVP
ncbi:MAG TPA: hypothetical protein VFO11_06860, partial [Candidatus Polarisedimenticolaceae bacterium]|nr:hypothetical protein [Candidatus Polarisedimenticolaceae bacterium]